MYHICLLTPLITYGPPALSITVCLTARDVEHVEIGDLVVVEGGPLVTHAVQLHVASILITTMRDIVRTAI